MIPIIGSDFPKIVIPLIDSAQKNIDIVVYDWRWYENQVGHPVQQFNIALVRALKKGVQVRVILNKPDLVPILTKIGIKARVLRDRRTVHTKLMIIDNKTVIIGSHNYTRNAFGSNIETSIVTEIPNGQTRLQDFFNNLFVV